MPRTKVHRIEGLVNMSKPKRKFKRMQKGNIKSPWVKSSCEPEGLVVSVYYNGKIGLTGTPGVGVSGDDLPLLDRGITEAFKRLPWRSLDDLLQIADFIVDQGLVPVEKQGKED